MARDYIEYLKNAYMIFEIKKFDYSLRKQNLNDKKYYSADLGLSNLYRVANLKFKGSNLETIVALELLRRGFEIYYYKTQNGLEIDFVVAKNNKIEKLIQVSKSLENDKTKNRELEVFSKTVDELNLIDVKSIIISEDKSSKFLYNKQEIEVKNILEWLNFD